MIIVSLLVAAFALEGFVLFAIEDPMTRVVAGLALLGTIMWLTWSASQLIGAGEPELLHKRRFRRTRGRVILLLSEIKRLNGLVLDAQHGVHSPEETTAEIDAIEDRLHRLIQQIRDTAGHPDSEE